MFGFGPTLPVTEEQRQWIDDSFQRLSKLLGHNRLREAEVITPDAGHFPDRYDGTEATLQPLFHKVCEYMKVDKRNIEVEIFEDHIGQLRELLPAWNTEHQGAAGLYCKNADDHSQMIIALHKARLLDPLSLVATIAHELGHVILLGGELIDRNEPNMEPLTDLVTVFLGLGIFTANSAVQFSQFQNNEKQGWSIQRLGYLSEGMYGYALAKFAFERGEQKPLWIKELSTNVKAYYKRSHAWLLKRAVSNRAFYHP